MDDALALLRLVVGQNIASRVVFLDVVQRTRMQHGSISVKAFNKKAKHYNTLLANALSSRPRAFVCPQRLVNLPRYISDDGCHLTSEGMIRYAAGLRDVVLRYRCRT